MKQPNETWDDYASRLCVRPIAEPASEEEFRAMVDSVKVGECVTFPNGYIVDKRTYYASPAAPTIISSGWSG